MVRKGTTKKDLERTAELVRGLAELADNPSLGFEGRLGGVLDLGRSLLRLEVGLVAEVEGSRYRPLAVAAPPEIELRAGAEMALGDTFCADVVAHDGPVTIEDARKPHLQDHPFRVTHGVESYLGAPVRAGDRVFGTVALAGTAPRKRGFTDAELDMLRMMAAWVGTELARHQAEQDTASVTRQLEETRQEMDRVATQDALTGALNRRAILERLGDERNRCTREKRPVGVFLMDVDRYRRINDAVGYRAADLLLADVVGRVSRCLRSYDYLGRFAGKQFLAVLPGCDLASAAEIAERARVAIASRSFAHSEGEIELTASFGVSSTSAADLTDEQLLSTADKALFLAKQRGKNSVRGAPPTAEVIQTII